MNQLCKFAGFFFFQQRITKDLRLLLPELIELLLVIMFTISNEEARRRKKVDGANSYGRILPLTFKVSRKVNYH